MAQSISHWCQEVNFIVDSKHQEYSFVKPSAGGCSQFFSSYTLSDPPSMM